VFDLVVQRGEFFNLTPVQIREYLQQVVLGCLRIQGDLTPDYSDTVSPHIFDVSRL